MPLADLISGFIMWVVSIVYVLKATMDSLALELFSSHQHSLFIQLSFSPRISRQQNI